MERKRVSLGLKPIVVLPAALWAFAGLAAPSPPASIQIEPKEINIGMFYRGAAAHLSGTAPAGFKLSVACVGPEAKVELKKKGKVWGTLWMNVGDVVFDHVPSLYLVRSAFDGARPDARSVRPDVRLGLGYGGVEAQVVPARDDENKRRLFAEFVRLKEHERLYSAGPLAVEGGGPAAAVSADLALPANIPPGVYDVRLYGYQGDQGELLASDTLTVRRAGLVELVASMAQRHGLLYGILSVVVALAAGFLTGVLFSKASKGH